MSSFQPTPVTDAERRAQSHAGLCARCRHLQLVRSKRSTFVRCALSDDDERFARYPPLPVQACGGFVEIAGEIAGGMGE